MGDGSNKTERAWAKGLLSVLGLDKQVEMGSKLVIDSNRLVAYV